MTDLEQVVARVMAQHGWLRRGSRLLVAVSGGLDSMVLLHVLHRLSEARHWQISVAHFNHRLRGAASRADQRLVERVAAQLDLPVVCEAGDVRAFARRTGLSIEMAARELRHEFLARTARRLRCRHVALAHHADDQVELFFVRLLRGAGPEGLAGMRWASPSPKDDRILLIRPLLGCRKADLADYARAERIAFREDATNRTLETLRNRVRNELLPRLVRRYQPALRYVVQRTMNVLAAEADYVAQQARAWLEGGGMAGPRAKFDTLPLALQRRVIQLQLQELGVQPEFELVEVLRQHAGQRIMVRPDTLVVRSPTGRVTTESVKSRAFRPEALTLTLAEQGGEVDFGGFRFRWRLQRPPHRIRRAPPRTESGCEYFDAERIGPVICLRFWRPGDRFHPSGLAQPVKLQDLFTNLKVPMAERRRRVVAVTQAGELFWVQGLRIAELFKLGKSTRKCLKWQWVRAGAAGLRP